MGDQVDTIFGQQYLFGLPVASQVTTILGFAHRGVSTSDLEPEVFVTATNGEGHVEAVAISKPENKHLTVELVGYIDGTFDRTAIPNYFQLFGRSFFVKKVSDPRQKGAFVECSISGESFPLVTAP